MSEKVSFPKITQPLGGLIATPGQASRLRIVLELNREGEGTTKNILCFTNFIRIILYNNIFIFLKRVHIILYI
jgi:hypothetical protein